MSDDDFPDAGIDGADIEIACDDVRIALEDLLTNGPNERDYERAMSAIESVRKLADWLNAI